VDGHGFHIPVRPAWLDRLPGRKLWTPLVGSRSPLKLQVRAASGVILSDDIVLPPPGCRLTSLGISGFCDAGDDGIVRGWVWRGTAQNDRLDVAVFVDQKFLTRVCANRYREDVHNSGHGDGEYGFAVSLPKAFRDGSRRRVDVILADSGLALDRSPLWAEGRRVTFKPQVPQQA
jgi:hypothetical protein